MTRDDITALIDRFDRLATDQAREAPYRDTEFGQAYVGGQANAYRHAYNLLGAALAVEQQDTE